jgi:hypothetical protein
MPHTTYTTTTLPALTLDLTDRAYDLYAAAFADVEIMAAQRHLMTLREFREICTDQRMTKYLVTDPDGEIQGMSVLTPHLHALPLLSPPFFRHRWPAQFTAEQIWYIAFACVRHPGSQGAVFERLIDRMSQPAMAARGLVFMDMCHVNVNLLLPGIRRTVARLPLEPRVQLHDSQQFWGFDFTQEMP